MTHTTKHKNLAVSPQNSRIKFLNVWKSNNIGQNLVKVCQGKQTLFSTSWPESSAWHKDVKIYPTVSCIFGQ